MTPQNHLQPFLKITIAKKKKKKNKKKKNKKSNPTIYADPTWGGAESQRSSACTTKLQEWQWRVVDTR